MGNPILRTPNLDRIAEQGIRFRNSFVTTAICCCSRASILTGQHMWRHGIRDFEIPLSAPQLELTYPVLLRKAGYRTAFLGKYGVGGAQAYGPAKLSSVDAQGRAPGTVRPSLSLPSDRFDFWYGFPQSINFLQMVDGQKRHLTELLTEKTIEFLRGNPADRPFCISLDLKEPHGPWNYFDPEVPDNYRTSDVPLPPSATQADFEAQPEFIRNSLNGYDGGRWPADARARFVREARTSYRLVEGVDRAVGRIMTTLQELNLDSDTVVIFTSDNGSLRGAHGLAGKWLSYEESVRVPLIIRDPRLPAGSRGGLREQMALNIDLAPTMLRLAGTTVPDTMQGSDLGPVLADPQAKWREEWFHEHTYTPEGDRLPIARSEAVRTTRWKYIRYFETTPRYEQLFDLVNDPLERTNLANKEGHKGILAEMRNRWKNIRRQGCDQQ